MAGQGALGLYLWRLGRRWVGLAANSRRHRFVLSLIHISFAAYEVCKSQYSFVGEACEAIDRDPDSIIRSAALVVCCGSDEAEVARRASNIGRDVDELSEQGLAGTPAQVVEKVLHFGELGISRLYLQVLDMKDLDHVRLIAAEVLPAVK